MFDLKITDYVAIAIVAYAVWRMFGSKLIAFYKAKKATVTQVAESVIAPVASSVHENLDKLIALRGQAGIEGNQQAIDALEIIKNTLIKLQ